MRTLPIAAIGLALGASLTPQPALAQPAPALSAEDALHTKLTALDYANAEVTDVLRALATQSKANVVINPGVKGQVTVHMRDRTVDEAILFVSNLAGAAVKRLNGTYLIAPRAEMRQMVERLGESKRVALAVLTPQAAADLVQASFPDVTARPMDKAVNLAGAADDLKAAEKLVRDNDMLSPDDVHLVERIPVKHRPAGPVAQAIVKMLPGVTAEAAGETIVVAGTKLQVDTARRSVDLLDTETGPQSELRVYRVKYMSPVQLINMLTKALPEVQVCSGPESQTPPRPSFNPISSQFVGFKSDSDSNNTNGNNGTGPGVSGSGQSTDSGNTLNARALTLLLKGEPSQLDQAFKVLALVDVAPRQMVIEAKVIETQPSVAEEIGATWSWTRFGFYEKPSGTSVTTGTTGTGGDFTQFITRPLGAGKWSRVPWSFQSVLAAKIDQKQAKLLANPSICVVDDQDASIFIGDTLRYQALASSSATAGTQYTVVEVPVGIILLVHPRVNDEGNITMRVHPVVSTVTGLTNGLPQTSAREAETSVRLKDGDTLLIGGLIRDEDLKEVIKVPYLSDLPFLGNLFKDRIHTHNRTEVMVVLTIHLNKQ